MYFNHLITEANGELLVPGDGCVPAIAAFKIFFCVQLHENKGVQGKCCDLFAGTNTYILFSQYVYMSKMYAALRVHITRSYGTQHAFTYLSFESLQYVTPVRDVTVTHFVVGKIVSRA